MLIEYSSNNSGGDWWLSDDDWYKLELNGWKVDWVKDSPHFKSWGCTDRWLGCLAKSAEKEFSCREMAILEWEHITGKNAEAEGCPCCGPPHNFYESTG